MVTGLLVAFVEVGRSTASWPGRTACGGRDGPARHDVRDALARDTRDAVLPYDAVVPLTGD